MSGDVAFEGQITLSGELAAKLSLSSSVRRLVACLIGGLIASGISFESLAGQTLRGFAMLKVVIWLQFKILIKKDWFSR